MLIDDFEFKFNFVLELKFDCLEIWFWGNDIIYKYFGL